MLLNTKASIMGSVKTINDNHAILQEYLRGVEDKKNIRQCSVHHASFIIAARRS